MEEGYSPIDGSLGRVDGFCCSLLDGWKRRRYLSVKGHTEVPCDCEETRLQESDQGKCALFRSRLSPNPLVETPDTLRTPQTIQMIFTGAGQRPGIVRAQGNVSLQYTTHVRTGNTPIVAIIHRKTDYRAGMNSCFQQAGDKVYSRNTSLPPTVFAQNLIFL